MLFEFTRQLQQMSSFNGAHRPFNQRAILVEMGNSIPVFNDLWQFGIRLSPAGTGPRNTLSYRRFAGPNFVEAHLPSVATAQRASFLVKLKPASLP